MYNNVMEFLSDIKEKQKSFKYECENGSFETIKFNNSENEFVLYTLSQYDKGATTPFYVTQISELELINLLNSINLKRDYKNAKIIEN